MSSGAARWDQPIMPGDAVPRVILDNVPMSDCGGPWDEDRGTLGALVRTLGNQDIPHLVLEGPESPLDVPEGHTIELEWPTSAESDYQTLQAAHNRSALTGQIYIDRPYRGQWIGDGTRTVYVLRSSFAFALVSFAVRPAVVLVDGVEQTVVTGAPAAGQVQIDTASNGDTLTFGTAPAVGAVVTCDHYPLHTYSQVELGLGWEGFNDGTLSVSFTLIVPWKAYA